MTGLLRLLGALFDPDRLAHGRLRKRSETALRALPHAHSVLFVCQGNQCRSPYAAEAFRRRLALAGHTMHIASAGFIGPNRPVPEVAIAVAAKRGVDIATHRSRVLNRSLLDGASLIVVMEPDQALAVNARGSQPRHVVVLGDLDPQSWKRRAIDDPMGASEAAYTDCYARIDRSLETLETALREGVLAKG